MKKIKVIFILGLLIHSNLFSQQIEKISIKKPCMIFLDKRDKSVKVILPFEKYKSIKKVNLKSVLKEDSTFLYANYFYNFTDTKNINFNYELTNWEKVYTEKYTMYVYKGDSVIFYITKDRIPLNIYQRKDSHFQSLNISKFTKKDSFKIVTPTVDL